MAQNGSTKNTSSFKTDFLKSIITLQEYGKKLTSIKTKQTSTYPNSTNKTTTTTITTTTTKPKDTHTVGLGWK